HGGDVVERGVPVLDRETRTVRVAPARSRRRPREPPQDRYGTAARGGGSTRTVDGDRGARSGGARGGRDARGGRRRRAPVVRAGAPRHHPERRAPVPCRGRGARRAVHGG